MIKIRKYDSDKRIDYIWYDSSNILYSECLDNENDFKTLKVVFKNGQSYIYKKVDVHDYVQFVHGGLEGSNGKALNSIIKPKYEFEKGEKVDITELLQRGNDIIEEQKKIKGK